MDDDESTVGDESQLTSSSTQIDMRNPFKALMTASCIGNTKVVEQLMLLKKDFFEYTHPQLGYSALHAAVDFERETVVVLLLRYGFDVNSKIARQHQTPLHLAVTKGNIEIAEKLLDSGADPKIRDDQYRRAFELVTEDQIKENPRMIPLRDRLKDVPPPVGLIDCDRIGERRFFVRWDPPKIHSHMNVAKISAYQISWRQHGERTEAPEYKQTLREYSPQEKNFTDHRLSIPMAVAVSGHKERHIRRKDRIKSYDTWCLATRRPHHVTLRGTDATTAVVENLYPSTTYHVAVRAKNPAGFGLASGQDVSVTTLPAAPEPPGQPFLLRSTKQALVVAWLPPRYENGMPVFAYELQRLNDDGKTLTYRCRAPGIRPLFVVGGLVENDSITVRVRAENDLGWSDWSETSENLEAVESMRPVQVETRSVILEWPTYLTRATHWELERQQYRITGRTEPWISIDSDITNTPPKIRFYVGEGLQPGQSYRFRARPKRIVRATPATKKKKKTDDGALYRTEVRDWDDVGTMVTAPVKMREDPPDPPDPPVIDLEACSASEMRISWTPGFSNGPPITAFDLAWAPFDPDAVIDWDVDGFKLHLDGLVTSSIVRDLALGQAFVFKVRAQNAIGWSQWSGLSTPRTTNPILPPGIPKLARHGVAWIELSWEPPPGGDVVKYIVQHKSSTADDTWRVSLGPTTELRERRVIVPDLRPATKFLFRVQALTLDGFSTFSDPSQPFLCGRRF